MIIGQAMQCDRYTSDISFIDGKGKFFQNTNKKFSKYLENINNITRIDISKLNGLVEEYEQILKKYQKYTEMTEERIKKLVIGLNQRINKLEEYIRIIK